MKPFNLEAARNGAPVQLSDGTETVRIICFDRGGAAGNIIALVGGITPKERIREFNIDGTPFHNNGSIEGAGLSMKPYATVDGIEVYTGDRLLDVGGIEFVAGPEIPNIRYFGATWPRKYPETRMTLDELDTYANQFPRSQGLARIANAAIKHGIDNGYLWAAPAERPSDDELVAAYYAPFPPMPGPPGSTQDLAKKLRQVWDLKEPQ